jgi:putative nucleotidyltransferase with HDIG domain
LNTTSQTDFTLDHVFENLTELPTFPKVVHRALTVLDDPKSTMSEITEVLRFDPSLTANIMRITNSARFGLARQVTSLETALALLGQRQIREVIVASGSLPYLTKPLHGYQMDASDLWEHSIAVATTVDILADYCKFSDPSVLFTAALLHDVGKIILNMHVRERLDEILTVAKQEDMTFTQAEWEVLGGDHAIIGSEILHQWEFPRAIVRAVRNHHDPDLYVQDDCSAILALGNILSVQLGLGVGADGFRHVISPKLTERLMLGRDDIHRCLRRALAAYEAASDLVDMYRSADSGQS